MSNAPLRSSTGGKSPRVTTLPAVATPRLVNPYAVFHSFMAPKGRTPRQMFETLHRRCVPLAETDADRWITTQPFETVFLIVCVEAICTDSRECWALVCLLIELYDESLATILAHAKVFAENYCEPPDSDVGGLLAFGQAAHLLPYWPAVQKKLGTRTTIGDSRVETGSSWPALARRFCKAYPLDAAGCYGERTPTRYACFFLSEWYAHLKKESNEQLVAAVVVPFLKLWSGEKISTPIGRLVAAVPPMSASIPISSSYTFLYDVLALKSSLSFEAATANPGTPLPHVRPLMEAVAYRIAAVSILADRSAKQAALPSSLPAIVSTWRYAATATPPLQRSVDVAPKAAPAKRPRVRKPPAAPEQGAPEEGAPAPKRARRPAKKTPVAAAAKESAPLEPAPVPDLPMSDIARVSEVLNEESNPAFAFEGDSTQPRAFVEDMDLGRIDYPDDI